MGHTSPHRLYNVSNHATLLGVATELEGVGPLATAYLQSATTIVEEASKVLN